MRQWLMTIDKEFLRHLRRVGILEGCSTLVLFGIAIPLKYLAGIPLAVTIVGTIHGVFFMLLVAMFLLGRERIPLSLGLTAAGISGAIVPFGPFVVDRWLVELQRADAADAET
jgi:integral membrane protein